MYILRKFIITIIIMIVFFSCKSQGHLTPEQAFTSLKSAYIKSDAESIVELLSERSKAKIKSITKMISQMEKSQLEALSERFGTNAHSMRNLSIKDYLTIQFSFLKRMGGDIFGEIVKYKIVGVDVKEGIAVVRIENGMELSFVKEGPYWKFDLEELSIN